jgi:hypothetical protein
MQTAYNPDTGDTLVLVDNEWVKPDQIAKNDAGEAAYLINNQWMLPGQELKPAAPTGMIGQAVDYLGDQANIIKKDIQVGLINTELAAKQAQLAEKMNLQEGRIGEFGPVAKMPEAERKKHIELQKSIEKDLLDVAKLSTDIRGIQATGGRKTTEAFQSLPQQKEYQEGDFWKKAAMTGEAFIKDPLGIATDIGLQSLPQSLAVAATAVAARIGQINPKATAAAGGASSAMAEFGGIYADLREKGIPHKEAWEQAGVKSGVIGLFDAASFYSAGSAMSQIAKDLSKGSIKGTAKEVTKEIGKQGALGASGEALGSTAINQAIDPVAVLSEAVGEVFGAPGEAIATYRGQPKAAPTVPPTLTPTPTPGVAPPTEAAPVEAAPPSISQDTEAMLAELMGQQPAAPPVEAPVVTEATAPVIAPEQPVVEKQQPIQAPEQYAIKTELADLYKEKSKIEKVANKDNLLAWLKKNQISPQEKVDMGIDPKERRLPVGIFSKAKGKGLDVLARAAVNDGVITEADLARSPDEVEAFRGLVYDALYGNMSQTTYNLQNTAALNSVLERIDYLENAPKEGFGLQAETEAESNARIAQEDEARKAQENEDIQAEMDALAERDRAEVARLSAQQAENFALGQTPEESLTGQQRLDDDIPFFSMERPNAKPYTKQVSNNERVLNEKIDELTRINIRRAAINRRFATDKLKPLDQIEAKTLLDKSKELEDDIENLKWATRNLTAEKFMKRATDALAAKEINRDVYDIIHDIFTKNPNLLEGLRLQIKQGNENDGNTNFQTAGEFIGRIVRLYKGTSGTEDPAIVRHELTHSLEQVMSKDAKKKLVQEWRNKLDKAQKTDKSPKAQAFFNALFEHLKNPSRESFKAASDLMPDTSYYQFMSPSEYWAVNAEKLLAANLGGAWTRFRNFVRGLFESLKSLFGFDNNSTIHKVFNEVIAGKREGTTMLTDLQGGVTPTKSVAKTNKYVTVDEIYKMQREAYNELAQTAEFKASQKRIDDARNEYINRFNDVKAEAVRLLKANPEFSKLSIALEEKKIIERVAMDAFQKQAEENVPLPKVSEGQMIAEQNKLIKDYFDSKGIPEPREFSEFANQNRAYYSDPKFRRWFGDSKVVDKNGQPLVAFHSTDKDFSEFNVGKGAPARTKNLDYTGQLGSWFTAPSLYDREYEAGNAENAVTFSEGNEGDNMMPVHLFIKNPMEYEGFEDLRDDRDSYKSIKEYKQALLDQGYDGVVVRNSMTDGNVDRDDWVAFDPRQIKSAIGNIGEFNPESPNITLSMSPKVNKHRNIDGQIVSPVWNSPEVSKVDNLLYKLQDKHIDTKRVVQAIQKEAGQLDDKWNVYLKEELYHGRTSAALRKFLLQDLMPTIKDMARLGISPDEMKEYLHNRHAKERNDQIAKIRPATLPDGSPNPSAMTDKGSGLSYKQIDEYFDKLNPSKAKKLKEVAQDFDKMIAGTQNILVASGAENQETIDAWNKTYKHYVPLFRVDDDFATHPSQGTGAGFSSSGGASKRATGSEKEVQDILGNILAQRERALIKAEKIRVGQALYGLAIKNPNPDFWLPINPDAVKNEDALAAELDSMGLDGQDIAGVMQEMKKPEVVMDRQTGLQTVRYKINPLERYKDNVFPVRVNGKDRYIFFNTNDPRAKRMVESMKNLDTEQLGSLLGFFGKFTRWFSAVNTQYNPVFGGINFLRDSGGAQFNLSTTKIAGKQGEVNAAIFPAMKAIWSTLKAERNGQPIPDTKMAKLWEEFKIAGGQTLYRDSLVRKAEEKQLIENELNKLKRGVIRKSFSGAVQLLSDFNDTIENAVRLAAYKVAVDNKLSKEQAASIAKNLTVNFDRKGQIGSRVNALYAFFNASMQGSARLVETLRGPQGRKIVAGGILLGVAQSIALAMAGFDEDEPPEFLKERNLVIPLGGKKYFLIPMPLGLHFIPTVGRVTTDFVLNGGKNPGKHVTNILGTALDAFNPLGGAGLSLQTLTPTVFDPLAALEANKDAFGRPIYRADRATNPTPGYSRSRESASTINKYIAEFLNYASGGTKYQKGAVSPTADALDYLVGQFTGGVGREVMKVDTAVKSAVTGEELPAYRIPIAGRFYGDADSKAADSQRFYDNVTKISSLENEIKGRRKNREDVAGFMRDNPQSRLWQQANNAENQISELNRRKKDFQERGLPRDKILAIDNQKQAIMKRFNDRVKELE